jgi:hypothetical protein
MKVNFDAAGGNYAVAEDNEGNQYTFRAREENGQTVITEANVRMADGTILKASMDTEGRPVNFRTTDNTAADIVYDGTRADIRLTGADGSLIGEGQGVDTTTAKARVQARRALKQLRSGDGKVGARLQGSGKVTTLTVGLEVYEEVVESVCDPQLSPGSPLATFPEASDLKEAARQIAEVAGVLGLIEVGRDDLGAYVTLDVVPEVIDMLAGRTFVLFDAEGFCLEVTEVASRLTFDNYGFLQSEFDRHVVFPDFSLGGGGDTGVTINYSTGTPVNLTPGLDVDFELIVTPVFTGTQLDALGRITIERRFQADLAFPVDVFGETIVEAHRLFDAAFLNGELSVDGSVLEVDLALIDLDADSPVLQLGRLRYHDQNVAPPPSVYSCALITGEQVNSGLICPLTVAEGEDFLVDFISGRDYLGGELDFDWFVSDGFGLVVGDSFGPSTLVRATAPGFVEVSLVVSDLSVFPSTFEVFTCGVNVGREVGGLPPAGLILECPAGLNIGEPGFFSVSGPDVLGLEFPGWFVLGTSDVFIDDSVAFELVAEFFQPGKFEVAFQGFDPLTGLEVYASCEVLIGGLGFDDCEVNGWYGDGVCDEFCLQPDPDCDVFSDICELNGWYGDGECDDFCPLADPDCEGGFFDTCAENGWYGDGECDLFCPLPDPDCDVEIFDICEENGWYGDGVCDEVCPEPDPDCDDFVDVCEANGWYGDGECDEFCPLPDPDCDVFADICELNGWYGDGECDDICPLPDPDCDDVCAINGWYGDGQCDEICPLPDPDCDDFEDICEINGWYGDGQCDDFCPLPDPDC